MNIRFSNAFDSGTQRIPAAVRNPDTRLRLILSLLGIVLLVAAVWLASRVFFGGGSKEHIQPAPPVKVATVGQQDVTVTEHTLGTVVANATVPVLSAPVTLTGGAGAIQF